MHLEFGKLSATELKDLFNAVKTERERRSKRSPDNHEPPTWTVPNKALNKGLKDAQPPTP